MKISERRRNKALLFLTPAVIYILIFYGYPIVKNVIMGFQAYTTTTFFTGEAPYVGLDNYKAIFSSPLFFGALRNTLLFTIGSIAGQFTIGLALALFFSRKFPLSGTLRSLILLPWLIPMIVSSAVWKGMLDTDSGVINRLISLVGGEKIGWLTDPDIAILSIIIVNVWVGVPFNMTILYGGLQDIPEELYEAASIDGASWRQQLQFITLPLLRPVITVVLVLGVVYTLKVVDIILGLTGGGPADSTQTLATLSYHTSFVMFDFGRGTALSNILILISLLFAGAYLLLNRRSYDD